MAGCRVAALAGQPEALDHFAYLAQLLALALAESDIECDPVQPGFGRSFRPPLLPLPESAHVSLLHAVFGGSSIPQDAEQCCQKSWVRFAV